MLFRSGALARDAVEAARPGAEHKGLALALDSRLDQTIVGDRTALRALVENLLDNAVRYTSQGSITVRTYRAASDAVFEVEDTGPGIPATERERVFDRFYRGSEATEGGSGLGLSIVRRIAERHRGKVELASASGANGLLVRVRFPLSPP